MGTVQGRYEGAKVNIQLQRKGDEIYMTAVATAKNGTVYKEMYHQTIGTDMVRAFLIVRPFFISSWMLTIATWLLLFTNR